MSMHLLASDSQYVTSRFTSLACGGRSSTIIVALGLWFLWLLAAALSFDMCVSVEVPPTTGYDGTEVDGRQAGG
jgi:hypothetical protein